MNPQIITWMQSLPNSALIRLLSKMPPEKQAEALAALKTQPRRKSSRVIEGTIATTREQESDTARKRRTRSAACEISIPPVVDPERRETALADPVDFLLTYFPDRYSIEFGPHHRQMIYDIVGRAKDGGRQAIAAPRGSGKSEIAKGLVIYAILAGLTRFPLIGAATSRLAQRLYQDIRQRFGQNDLLLEDFPEVCYPVRALEGAPQRAARQHIAGNLTNIVWGTNTYLRLPDVEGSPYGGIKLAFFGLDAAFRGTNIDGDRPDLVIVDDPETEQSARSHHEIERREEMLDKGISGLAGQGDRLGLVVLTTVQNSIALSAKLTDREKKPAYNGHRFGLIVEWPKNIDMWEKYISLRHKSQREGDEHGIEAVDFYLANREKMDEGVEMLTDYFKPQEVDGRPVIYSAIQAAFNQIAETSIAAFRAEYQNDPEPEEEMIGGTLTAARVQGRVARTKQGEVSEFAQWTSIGIDVGKRYCHWVRIDWEPNAIGTISDYGILETVGVSLNSDDRAVGIAIATALEMFAEEVMAADNAPQLVLVDSGTFTEGVYEAMRRIGRPFFPAKGRAGVQFRMPREPNPKQRVSLFEACYSNYLPADNVHLYHVDVEHWKLTVQERFLVETYNSGGDRNAGSLALFDPEGDTRRHLSIAHHLTAEELRLVPVPGKDYRREWFVKNRNNHFLDATVYAAAAGGALGVRLFDDEPRQQIKRRTTRDQPVAGRPLTDPYGRPFSVLTRGKHG